VRLAEALPFRRAAEWSREPPFNEPPRSFGRRSSGETGKAHRTSAGTASITLFVCRRTDAVSSMGHSDAVSGASSGSWANSRGAHWSRAMPCQIMGPSASVFPPSTASPTPWAGSKASQRSGCIGSVWDASGIFPGDIAGREVMVSARVGSTSKSSAHISVTKSRRRNGRQSYSCRGLSPFQARHEGLEALS
jgi:hypothetical protein